MHNLKSYRKLLIFALLFCVILTGCSKKPISLDDETLPEHLESASLSEPDTGTEPDTETETEPVTETETEPVTETETEPVTETETEPVTETETEPVTETETEPDTDTETEPDTETETEPDTETETEPVTETETEPVTETETEPVTETETEPVTETETEPVTETETEPDTETELLPEAPKVLEYTNVKANEICIAGRCPENVEVILRSDVEEKRYIAHDRYFIGTVEIPQEEGCKISVSYLLDGKESESSEVTADYINGFIAIRNDDMNVVVGKDYQCHFVSAIPDLQRENVLSENQLQALTRNIRKKNLFAENNSMEIIYLLVPNPMTVYPETVDDMYTVAEGESRMSQFADCCREAGATVIDLTDTMIQHKNDEFNIYFKTDSHWSEYGAWLGYVELMNHISQKFPAAAPRSFDEMGFYTKDVNGGDMPYYLNFDVGFVREISVFASPAFDMPVNIKKYKESNGILIASEPSPENTITTGNEELPNAYVIRDSYGIGIYDFLAERMNTTYYQAMWHYGLDEKKAKEIDADYIIYIITEHNLISLLN